MIVTFRQKLSSLFALIHTVTQTIERARAAYASLTHANRALMFLAFEENKLF